MNDYLEIYLSKKKSYWKASKTREGKNMTKASIRGAKGGSLNFLQELQIQRGNYLGTVRKNINARISRRGIIKKTYWK